jgi:plastocyanin
MSRRLLLLLCLPAAALPAGCGAHEPAAVRAKGHRIAIEAQDFRYTPQTIVASPGPLRLDIVNHGRLAHTLWVSRGAGNVVARASSLLPGDRTSKTLKVRKGRYRFFCPLSNHQQLGMYGTLIVR